MQELKKRSEVEKQFRWRIEDLYASDDGWETEYEKTGKLCQELSSYQGRLLESAETLYQFLSKKDEMNQLFERVYVYANQRYHEDTANAFYQGLSERASRLSVEKESCLSFEEAELLEGGEEKISVFMDEKKELSLYQRYFKELFRQKEHVLSKEQELLLARAQEVAEAPSNVFSMFNNADISFPEIADEEGTPVKISHARYMVLLKSKDRRVRKEAFEGLYASYGQWKNTLASLYAANVKQDAFFAWARHYKDSRAMALSASAVPESVYDHLIEAVHRALPAMYRYLALRKKVLGLSELHMYDVYVPMVSDVDMKISFEEAKKTVKKALLPLGEDYVELLQKGFDEGWIDVYENEGKRSGAYSWGAYGTHPYVLLNHQDNLNSMFTLAHEMGHAMHSYFSDKTQPYVYAGYRIFVAEVASTCNESLLVQYLLSQTEEKKLRAYYLNYWLEQFRTTLFRQTMFAEFEYLSHKMSAGGQALTAESLCELYGKLNRTYFGPDTVIDGEIKMEWARIPHFYTPFYVYQYATGYSAAMAISKKILDKEEGIQKKYRSFLSGGSSMDCIDLLKLCDVDMASGEPVSQALSMFEQCVTELEALLG